MNKGLQLCDTVIMIPLSTCIFNVSCLFNGLVYYDQWDRFTWYQLFLTMLGVAITIGGVLLISHRSKLLVEEEIIEVVTEDTPLLRKNNSI